MEEKNNFQLQIIIIALFSFAGMAFLAYQINGLSDELHPKEREGITSIPTYKLEIDDLKISLENITGDIKAIQGQRLQNFLQQINFTENLLPNCSNGYNEFDVDQRKAQIYNDYIFVPTESLDYNIKIMANRSLLCYERMPYAQGLFWSTEINCSIIFCKKEVINNSTETTTDAEKQNSF